MTSKSQTDEQLAKLFHDTYERLAPEFNYETRKASAVPWSDVPPNNKQLMIAVAHEVNAIIQAQLAQAERRGRIDEAEWTPSTSYKAGAYWATEQIIAYIEQTVEGVSNDAEFIGKTLIAGLRRAVQDTKAELQAEKESEV